MFYLLSGIWNIILVVIYHSRITIFKLVYTTTTALIGSDVDGKRIGVI